MLHPGAIRGVGVSPARHEGASARVHRSMRVGQRRRFAVLQRPNQWNAQRGRDARVTGDLLDRIDGPSDSALAVDDLSAFGCSHTGAEPVFARFFSFRQSVRIMHVKPLWCTVRIGAGDSKCQHRPSRAMIQANFRRGKGFLPSIRKRKRLDVVPDRVTIVRGGGGSMPCARCCLFILRKESPCGILV